MADLTNVYRHMGGQELLTTMAVRTSYYFQCAGNVHNPSIPSSSCPGCCFGSRNDNYMICSYDSLIAPSVPVGTWLGRTLVDSHPFQTNIQQIELTVLNHQPATVGCLGMTVVSQAPTSRVSAAASSRRFADPTSPQRGFSVGGWGRRTVQVGMGDGCG